MIKKYLLKNNTVLDVVIDKKVFKISKVSNQITINMEFSNLPISILDGTTVNKETVVLGSCLSTDKANAILEALGIEVKLVEEVEEILDKIKEYGQSYHNEEHTYNICLCYDNNKLKGAFPDLSNGKYRNFGTKFYKKETVEKLCNMLNETLEVMEVK
jgi:hypothetical protein